MSAAPETIYTSRLGQWLVNGDTPRWETDVEYRRADLPPTLSAAMELPEVRALVEALKHEVKRSRRHLAASTIAALAPFKT